MNSPWQIKAEDFPAKGSMRAKVQFLLGYAILAPSAHNTQPWTCKLSQGCLEVYYNQDRSLPVSDPTHRQAFISLGAFVYNFVTAAEAFGIAGEVRWLPNNSDFTMPVAVVVLREPSGANSSANQGQLELIKKRRVNRSHYQKKEIEADILSSLGKLSGEGMTVTLEHRPEIIEKIAHIVALGTRFAFSNPKFRNELSHYVTPNLSNRKDGIPGNTANLGLLGSYVLPRLMRFADIGPSQAEQERKRFLSASYLLVIGGDQDNPMAWLKAGYLFQEISLFLTDKDIAFAVSGAAIEPPVSPMVLARLLGVSARPLVLMRLGYSTSTPPHSPRYPVADILSS